jgi:hypothetical protein
MLRAQDLAFVKVLASPAILEELRKAVAARRVLRRPTGTMGRRGPINPVSSHRPLHHFAAKRKATELSGPSDPRVP